MHWLRLWINELILLCRSKLALALIVITAAFAAVGMDPANASNQLSLHGTNKSSLIMSLGSAQHGAMAGAAMFGMLTLIVLSRDQRKQSRDLLDASLDYSQIIRLRLFALLVWGSLAVLATFLVTFLIHHVMTDLPFEMVPYLFSHAAILLPAILISILVCGSLYLLFESIDIAFVSFGMFYVFGFSASNYLFRWVQTSASAYSDFGGIEPVGRLVVYNRLFSISVAVVILLAGLLVLRRLGCTTWRSVVRNARSGLLPGALAVAFGIAVFVYLQEPHLFANDSVLRTDLPKAEKVLLESVECTVKIHPYDKTLRVEARYEFEKNQESTEIIFIANAGMDIESTQVNGEPGSYARVKGTDWVRVTLPPGVRTEVEINYHGTIRYPGAGGFPGYVSEKSVYLLENSHWLFEPMTGTKERIQVSGSVAAPPPLTVVTPGRVTSMTDNGTLRVWEFEAVCQTLRLGLFAADYTVEKFKAGEASVEFYYSPKHKDYIKRAKITEYIQDILDYYQKTLGPYGVKEFPLKVVETSVYKPGGHSSLNIVTVAEYFLNREVVIQAEKNPRFMIHDLKTIAHEIAHQWWGTGVAIEPNDEWSSEGLAEYVTYKYLTDRFESPYVTSIRNGWSLSVSRQRGSYYMKNPKILKHVQDDLKSQINMSKRQVDVYNLMPLKLIKAEQVLGEQVFAGRLSSAYGNHIGKTLTYDVFLSELGLTLEEIALD